MRRDPLVQLPPALTEPSTVPHARFLLGIDGGATKTLAAVLDISTGQVHLGHGGPSNPDSAGASAAVAALLGAAEQALAGAGISAGELASAVVAVAGTDTEAVAERVGAARAGWVVVNDVVGAWATATGARPGVAAIAGTGSNVFGVGPGGRSWRAGGWGHVLGDEGSGYWLGVRSIRAALRDRDGSGPPTALAEAAPRFFGLDSPEELASHVYAKPLTKSEIAAFAIETGRIAESGDEVARTLYEEGARELGEQIAAVVSRCGLEGEFTVGLIGSAFKAGPVFTGPLARHIHGHSPHALVRPVETAPVGGSLLLAARACGHSEALAGLDLAAALAAPAAG
jgi:N-acetylglucosamine kinase-like BadF-type ATPase